MDGWTDKKKERKGRRKEGREIERKGGKKGRKEGKRKKINLKGNGLEVLVHHSTTLQNSLALSTADA